MQESEAVCWSGVGRCWWGWVWGGQEARSLFLGLTGGSRQPTPRSPLCTPVIRILPGPPQISSITPISPGGNKDPPSGREMTPSLSGQGFSCSVAWRPPGTDSSQLLRAAEAVGSEAWAAGQEGSSVAASGLDAVLSFLTETRGRHLLVGPGQELMTGGLAPGLG